MPRPRLTTALFCTGLALGACASGGSSSGGSASSSGTSEDTATAPATPIVEVTANSLNVRREPSPSGAVVGTLKHGERVAAPRAASDGWVYVQSDSGISGYVSASYVRPAEAAAPTQPAAQAATPPLAQAATPPPPQETKPDYTPAPGSKLAKVTKGMTTAQVIEVMGTPTSEGSYVTGKAFIPYYYGSDTSRMEYRYAGQGRVVFTRNRWSGGLTVVEVQGDPSEDGH